MFKHIVVPMTQTQGDPYAIDAALELADAFEAQVAVLEIVNLPFPAAAPWGAVPELAMSDVYQQLREQGQKNVASMRKRLEGEKVATQVLLAEAYFSEPSKLVAHHAHYADLIVIAGSKGDTAEGDVALRYFSSVLLDSGRPVVVVPPLSKAILPPKHIVAAWKPTGECARAFHDALPLFKMAENVDVVIVDPVMGESGHGEQPGADIAAHLARHGVKVNVLVRPSEGNRIAKVLLNHVQAVHAGMIVAGGYGHSRIREWALGGATRELFFESVVPVFFSH